MSDKINNAIGHSHNNITTIQNTMPPNTPILFGPGSYQGSVGHPGPSGFTGPTGLLGYENVLYINTLKLKPNSDGTFDYDGDLNLSHCGLKSFKDIQIRFKNVSGNILCYGNKFISLNNFPETIGGDVYCSINYLLSDKCLSKISGNFERVKNPFKITDEVIETIKEMNIDQRMEELKFFKEVDKDAYEMMLKILNDYDLGYGPRAKEMLDVVNGFDNISNLV